MIKPIFQKKIKPLVKGKSASTIVFDEMHTVCLKCWGTNREMRKHDSTYEIVCLDCAGDTND